MSNELKLETSVEKTPTVVILQINPKFVQLYSSGVIKHQQCETSDKVRFVAAVTGYSRTGQAGSMLYWQVRGNFGLSWGMKGLMRIEKFNTGANPTEGACSITKSILGLTVKVY